MVKRFFIWGYNKYVFMPALKKKLNEPQIEYVIEWVPDPDLALEIESKHATKH